jgi:hypothetical protein
MKVIRHDRIAPSGYEQYLKNLERSKGKEQEEPQDWRRKLAFGAKVNQP